MEITFTFHAECRIRGRGMFKEDVLLAIRNPDNTVRKYDKYYFQKRLPNGILEVCCDKIENNIKVITVYWV